MVHASSSPYERAKYVLVACAECRRIKKKCSDGNECARCKKRNIPCVKYERKNKSKKFHKSFKSIDDLEANFDTSSGDESYQQNQQSYCRSDDCHNTNKMNVDYIINSTTVH
ncbi:9053_t:CDS:2 [Entrophospora sp. SA101]|nr:1147_t:CDS:2 [Entrophospora sp. SA101]CAJ0631218.1 9053_t:CDS:2 [Entrophospora sp. SA101]CAJ0826049.1 3837_t:CDS:2 [Entrophospora sp. SA101]CAJ0829067.1 14927_t:CDS:2 [Entrophospora sp. SA101]CAJ0834038.1 1265_t:CDS:2 [Entrophospora sp. SA101]